MSQDSSNKLGAFLREVSNWDWEEFCLAENDPIYTSNQALIFALVRSCAMEKMEAIKLALNRIDGKLKTPIKIEYPKIFYTFPRAAISEANREEIVSKSQLTLLRAPVSPSQEIVSKSQVDPEPENDLPSLSLRQTLAKMSDHPRQVPEAIIAFATQTQQWMNGQAEEPPEKPLVKSVVAAHLLRLAQERNVDALSEVFDQIDGKLVETIQLLDEDIFITVYSTVAPDGAYLNKDGVLQIEAVQPQDLWAHKLANK